MTKSIRRNDDDEHLGAGRTIMILFAMTGVVFAATIGLEILDREIKPAAIQCSAPK